MTSPTTVRTPHTPRNRVEPSLPGMDSLVVELKADQALSDFEAQHRHMLGVCEPGSCMIGPCLRAAVEAAAQAAEDEAEEAAAEWWLRHRAGEPAQPATGQLGTSVNISTAITGIGLQADEIPDETRNRQERRREKYARRNEMRRLLRALDRADHGMVGCGLNVVTSGGVQLRLSADGVAGIAGVATCGSQSCEVCTAKVAAHRAQELGDALGWAREQGHALAMVTLTVRHQKGDPLAQLWDAVADAWGAVTSGSEWGSETPAAYAKRRENWEERGAAHDAWTPADGGRRPRAPKGWAAGQPPVRHVGEAEAAGVLGWVRATEVTHGRNGWHVHVHAVLVVERNARKDKALAENVRELGESMHSRWKTSVEASGFDSWRDSGGLDVTITDAPAKTLAEYLVKSSDSEEHLSNSVRMKARALAREASLGAFKSAKEKGRTPLEIGRAALEELDDLERDGVLGESIELWDEWLTASHGRRMVGWSAGLREMAKLGAERTDEDVASEETGSHEDALLNLSTRTWWHVQPHVAGLLSAAENGGREGAEFWLLRRGHEWTAPTELEYLTNGRGGE